MASVTLIDGEGTRYSLTVDTEEGAETLQCQVFSLTGVEPGRQRLFCDAWQGPLPDDAADLRTAPHVLKDGDVVAMWPPHDTGAQPQAPDMAQQLAMYQDMTDGHRLNKIASLAAGTPSRSLQQLLGRCQGAARHVMLYERPDWQAQAVAVVPVAKLLQQAVDCPQASRKGTFRDTVLFMLLRWFKHGFFSWVNAPPCQVCGKGTGCIGQAAPNAEERVGMAGVVEVYRCKDAACASITRFPRYNNPLTLLSTKRGRCGEWANCFTFVARSMGFDVRHVHDWTDHVWTEAWSTSAQRWIHLDACEAAYDAPMTYESGWGKKLSYVIAFGADGVVDVTRRYTKRLGEVLRRRTLAPEPWLAGMLQVLDSSQRYRRPLTPARAALVRLRGYDEVRELEANVGWDSGKRSKAETQGRLSGSLAWRASRGETGDSTSGAGPLGVTPYTQLSGLASQLVSTGWQRLGPLGDDALHVTSFGQHLVVMTTAHTLRFAAMKVLIKAGAGAGGAGAGAGAGTGAGAGGAAGTTRAVRWHPFRTQSADGGAWPTSGARVTALTGALTMPLRLFAADEAHVWMLRPQAPPPSDDAAAVAEDKALGRMWAARLLAPVPPGVTITSLCVRGTTVLAVATPRSGDAESSRLLRLNCDVSGTGVVEAVAAGDWVDVGEACGVHSVTSSPEGVVLGVSQQRVVVHTPLGDAAVAAPAVTSATSAKPVFTVPRTTVAGTAMTTRLELAPEALALAAGAWVGLHRVGDPSELVGVAWRGVEEAAEAAGARASATTEEATTALAGLRSFTLAWPAQSVPTAAGLFELRLFGSPGFSRLLASSQPLRLVSPPLRALRLTAAAGGSGAGSGASAGADEAKTGDEGAGRSKWVPPREAAAVSVPVPGPELFPATGTSAASLTMGASRAVSRRVSVVGAGGKPDSRARAAPDFAHTGPAITAVKLAADAEALPPAAVRVKLDPVDDAAAAIVPSVGTGPRDHGAHVPPPVTAGLKCPGTEHPAVTDVVCHSGTTYVVVADTLREASGASAQALDAKAAGAPAGGASLAPGYWRAAGAAAGAQARLCCIGAGDGRVSCSGENAGSHEVADNLLDGNAKTKWLDVSVKKAGASWVAIDLDRGVAPHGVAPTHYALTSANDCAERDPATWVLEGMPSTAPAGSAEWVPLDQRDGQRFRQRFGVQHFAIKSSATAGRAFRAFRLRITQVHDPSAAHCTQLARLQIFCAVPGKASGPLVATPWAAVAGDAAAGSRRPGPLTALIVDYARDGADRRWSLAVATPPLDSVVGTAQGIVAVARGPGGAWLSQPPPALAAVVCGDEAGTRATAATEAPAPPTVPPPRVSVGESAGARTAPPAPPAPPAAAARRSKAEVAAATKRLFVVLTKGCGNATCSTSFCASNPGVTPLPPSEAAATALRMALRGEGRLPCSG